MAWNISKFLVYNEGLGGSPPGLRLYSFENEHISKWPNVISFEYGLNCGATIGCAEAIDSLISFVKDKYLLKDKYTLFHVYRVFQDGTRVWNK